MCAVLLNIRCSNRCAKPERPCGSSFEPTWYQTCTATVGPAWSSTLSTCRPLASVRSRYFTAGTANVDVEGDVVEGDDVDGDAVSAANSGEASVHAASSAGTVNQRTMRMDGFREGW